MKGTIEVMHGAWFGACAVRVAILSGLRGSKPCSERIMVIRCSAVGCHNKYKKGSGLQFYHFPRDLEGKSKWVAALRSENWDFVDM